MKGFTKSFQLLTSFAEIQFVYRTKMNRLLCNRLKNNECVVLKKLCLKCCLINDGMRPYVTFHCIDQFKKTNCTRQIFFLFSKKKHSSSFTYNFF